MSPRAPRLSSDEMIKVLRCDGFAVRQPLPTPQGDAHRHRTVIVPLGRDPLRLGTQSDILRQAGVDAERLCKLR